MRACPTTRGVNRCVVFSQGWIHRITDNLLVSSKAAGELAKGRDSGRIPASSGEATAQLADDDDAEDTFGVGYLNPAFDDHNANGRPFNINPGSLYKHSVESTYIFGYVGLPPR